MMCQFVHTIVFNVLCFFQKKKILTLACATYQKQEYFCLRAI